jgi:hypothetical protein
MVQRELAARQLGHLGKAFGDPSRAHEQDAARIDVVGCGEHDARSNHETRPNLPRTTLFGAAGEEHLHNLLSETFLHDTARRLGLLVQLPRYLHWAPSPVDRRLQDHLYSLH